MERVADDGGRHAAKTMPTIRLDNLAKRALTEHHDDLKEFLAGHELEVGVECKPMFSMLTNSVPIANIDIIVIIRGSP